MTDYIKIILDIILLVGLAISASIVRREIKTLKDLISTQETVIKALKQGIDDIAGAKEWYKRFSDELTATLDKVRGFGRSAMDEIEDLSKRRLKTKDEYIGELEGRLQRTDSVQIDLTAAKRLSKQKSRHPHEAD